MSCSHAVTLEPVALSWALSTSFARLAQGDVDFPGVDTHRHAISEKITFLGSPTDLTRKDETPLGSKCVRLRGTDPFSSVFA